MTTQPVTTQPVTTQPVTPPPPSGPLKPGVTGRSWQRLAGSVALGLSLLGLYAYWVPHAGNDAHPGGDAVVVHAGNEGERLDVGLRLMDQGAAPTLVIMLGRYSPRTRPLCGQVRPYEVLCPEDPRPATTLGEARAVVQLVEARDWHRLVVVTSEYHLRRASYLDAKCSGIDVERVGAPRRGTREDWFHSSVKEMAALPIAWLASC